APRGRRRLVHEIDAEGRSLPHQRQPGLARHRHEPRFRHGRTHAQGYDRARRLDHPGRHKAVFHLGGPHGTADFIRSMRSGASVERLSVQTSSNSPAQQALTRVSISNVSTPLEITLRIILNADDGPISLEYAEVFKP